MTEEKKWKSKISNVEWGIFIAFLAMIDAVQFCLDLILIGYVLNPGIDIFVAMSMPLYLKLRGEKIGDAKSIGTFIGTFILKFIPFVEDLPLWCMDGFIFMLKSKSAEIIGEIPGAKSITPSAVKK